MVPYLNPKASFHLEKEIYDDGEAIVFNNNSENTKSCYWVFGENDFCTDVNPVKSFSLNGELTKLIPISLEVYGKSGDFDSVKKTVRVSLRLFSGYVITSISKDLIERIEVDEKKKTSLVANLGPISEIDGWSPPQHILPEEYIERNFSPPYYYEYGSPTNRAMNNSEWYLRLSTRLDGQKTPTFLKEFRFNPTTIKPKHFEGKKMKFTLTDDEMTIDIVFEYALDQS